MRATKIAAIMSLLLAPVLGTAEASEMLRGRILMSPPGTKAHRTSVTAPSRHRIKVIGLYGQVTCVHRDSCESHQLRKGELLHSGARLVTSDHAHCELEWKGAAVSISSNSNVIVDPDSHQVTVVRGHVHWVFLETNQENYTVKTSSSSFTTREGNGSAAAFPMYDGISVLDAEGNYRKVTATN